MKLRRLFLKAYGPFTNAELDLSGSANVHLIHGPNEAGKSSALRAMTDLRYGIHPRSRDNFVHDFRNMLVSACFETATGDVLALARRKGNRDTLLMADPATGAPIPQSVVATELQLSLTGGLEREQFETMYGLNSERLRNGGRLLLEGDGELGAALFAASTGATGISLLLKVLQADAGKYFTPRSQSSTLNEASRQLDEARLRYKNALTKPQDWKTLYRNHQSCVLQLQHLRQQLTHLRQRLADLGELRAVEPILRQLDQADQAWGVAEAFVELPIDARERRQAAQHQWQSAQQALLQADQALLNVRSQMQTLQIEPQLLAQAAAIGRLEADLAAARRDREARLNLETSTQQEVHQLLLRAAQMSQADAPIEHPDDFFRQLPSPAEQTRLLNQLDAYSTLQRDRELCQMQLQEARAKRVLLEQEQDKPVPAALQQALSERLKAAQALGDSDKQQADLQTAAQAEQRKLDRVLKTLGLPTPAALSASGTLPSAEIDAYDQQRLALLDRLAQDVNQRRVIQTDLLEQQRRYKRLLAIGEVVTATTLKDARRQRDQGWQDIRSACIDKSSDQGTDRHRLAAAFEQLQRESDRQADLLREGAQRAAEVAECRQRIDDMTQFLLELEASHNTHERQLLELDAAWKQRLNALMLPQGTATALREWQRQRDAALEQHERLLQNQHSQGRLQQQIDGARTELQAALHAVGRCGTEPTPALGTLIRLAAQVDRELLAAQAAQAQRHQQLRSLQADVARHSATENHLSQTAQQQRAALDAAAQALQLAAGAAPAVMTARMAEIQQWVLDYQKHQEHALRLHQMNAALASLDVDTLALSRLLHEDAGSHHEAWVDLLSQRLAASREAAATKLALERQSAEAVQRRSQAEVQRQAAEHELLLLTRLAGVPDAEQLPEAEQRAEQRRQAHGQRQRLQQDVAAASSRSVEQLRLALHQLDRVAIDQERQQGTDTLTQLEAQEQTAIAAEQQSRMALAAVDGSDRAAQAREDMESAIARYRAGIRPWAQLKLAEALLAEALRRYREKAQGPVLALAGDYFRLMTGGRFIRLQVDASAAAPLLLAQPAQGSSLEMAALSEGTSDQLYLALRLAALQVQRKPERMMPLVLDDVFITSDDERAANMFKSLEKYAEQGQVLIFTHHLHLVEIARRVLATAALQTHRLG